MSEIDDRRSLHTAIIRISMLSQVPASSLERSSRSTDDEIGGRRPKGGIIAKDDFAEGYLLKSAEYFQRRLARCHTPRAVTELLAEAEATLEAWKRTPIPPGQPPQRGEHNWKRWVAESDEDAGRLADQFSITRQYVYMLRRQYRDAA